MCAFRDRAILYLSSTEVGVRKVDIHLTASVRDNSRNIVCSELTVDDVNRIVPVDKTGRIRQEVYQILGAERHVECEYTSEHHIIYFLEHFEMCARCSSYDRYRMEYYLFKLRHHLLILELINRGEKEHLYLPKFCIHRHKDTIAASLQLFSEGANIQQLLCRYKNAFIDIYTKTPPQNRGHIRASCNGGALQSADSQFLDELLTQFIAVNTCPSRSAVEGGTSAPSPTDNVFHDCQTDENVSCGVLTTTVK
eukprot:TRINITY_DN16452_c0_g2_i1.p1 TRINITY_DN16452_c0_g2~~TRINITY_DN16452_c0_g2_i1.p1  ORF type:complete len:252 (+),score=4.19 TRINITY_DN16452_c0_g2_i1:167-922(+)